jgi:glycosyltransferase involved in cell wall biosynthesis
MSIAARAPVVSVLLSVRDGEATLGRAVASIRAQTFREWEMIVVDDGSRDGTAELLRALVREEPRIRVLTREREGLVPALNAGLAELRGELVARMDADDEAHPERLAEQVAFLRSPENREVGVVSCLVEFGGDRVRGQGYALHVDWLNTLVAPEEIALNRFIESPLANPSAMFRRELVAWHGAYRAGDFPEDYELWLRWLDAGVRIAKVPRVLLTWHDSPTRLTRTHPSYSPDAFFRAKAEWIAREVARCAGGRRVLVWGAGRPTRKRAAHLERFGVNIAGYVDVDAKKFTRAIGGTGREVMGADALPPPGEVLVLGYVTSRGAREFIRADLSGRGFVEGRDFLMCA